MKISNLYTSKIKIINKEQRVTNILILRYHILVLFLLLTFLNGCSTIQTKASENNHVGHPYSGTKKAVNNLFSGPKNDNNYGPNGAVGTGALLIPVIDFFEATVFYIYNYTDFICSIIGDTLFLPVDLIYKNSFDINQVLHNRDIKALLKYYKSEKITEPPLISAIVTGRHDTVDEILKQDPKSVYTKGPLGYSPLFYAAASGNRQNLDSLISAGAKLTPSYAAVILVYIGKPSILTYLFDKTTIDPSQVAPKGEFYNSNLLTAALRSKKIKLAHRFIKAGANLDHQDDDDFTPLYIAVSSRDLNMTTILLDHGAKANEDALIRVALRHDSLATFELLLQYGSPIPHDALYLAVDRDDINLIQRLIDMGVLNKESHSSGNSALHLAASQGKPDIIQLLVGAGMNINIQNKHERGATPLWKAVDSRKPEAVRTLIELGADPNIPMISASAGPITPLKEAFYPIQDYQREIDPDADTKRQAIISLLIPKSKITYDDLLNAVHARDAETVSILINRGIDPIAGVAIYYAEDPSVRDLLVNHGANAEDYQRFIRCVSSWENTFSNVHYSGTPEENCEYHCKIGNDAFCR